MATIQEQLPAIKKLRQTLYANGFRPVAITAGAKYPYQKHWPELARLDPPHAVDNIDPTMPGTGILCDGLRGIDIDIDDPNRAQAMAHFVEAMFGAAPYRFRDGSPRRLYVFRAAEGEPRKLYVVHEPTKARVEVLGLGQQFFAYGTHPDSGEELQWSVSLEAIHRGDLPTITEPQVCQLLDFAEVLIHATRATHRPKPDAKPRCVQADNVRLNATPSADAWPLADLVAALDAIPCPGDYDQWFRISAAYYHSAGAESDAHVVWKAWCASGSGYSAAASDKLWNALADAPQYYGPGTLVHIARENDPSWDRPSRHSNPTYHFEEDLMNEEPFDDEPVDPGAKKPAKFRRYSMTDLMAITLPKWLIRDLLYERQVAVLYAPSGSFKSFLTLALSSMLAHEMEWQGRALKRRRVVYLAGEGFALFGTRRLAWFKHHHMEPRDDGLEVVDGTVNLLDDADVDAFIASMKDAPDTDLLVIDTLSTSTAGQDENTSPVMTKAVTNGMRIQRALRSALLFVHHPGKDVDRGLRGHSSLGANIDAVWFAEKIEDGKKLLLTTLKQKDGVDGKLFCFSVHHVPLGIFDEDGLELGSLVLEPCETPQAVKAKRDDFGKVASVMKLDEQLSIAQIVDRLLDYKLMDCKKRQASTRVSRAVPTEWRQHVQFGKEVELIRLPGVNGEAHKITMRLAEIPSMHP